MNRQSQLRRPGAIAHLVVLAALGFTAPAPAATVTLSGANGNSCTYASVATAADGSMTVTCAAGASASAGSVQFAVSSYSVTAGANVVLSVTRTGGSAGATSASWGVFGTACVSNVGAVGWADGDTSPQTITVQALAAGTCTARLNASSPAAIGTPSSATINVTGGSTGTGTVTVNTVRFVVPAYSVPTGSVLVGVSLARADNNAVGMYYNVTGNGCAPQVNGQVNWAAGDSADKAIGVNVTGAAGTTCNVAFGTGSASVGTPSSATLNVTGGTTGGPPPPIPNTVQLEFPSYSGQGGLPLGVGVLLWRGLGNTDGVGLYYSVTGSGCMNVTNGQVNWASGESGRKEIIIGTQAPGSCQITLGGTNAVMGSPWTASAAVTMAASSGPTATAGCPAGFVEPSDLLAGTIGGAGIASPLLMPTDRVFTMLLPTVDAAKQYGTWAMAAVPTTPSPLTLRTSISRCRGYIDTDSTNFCNLTATPGALVTNTWYPRASGSIVDAASASAAGFCWAPADQGPWYLNVKMSYQTCVFGSLACGMSLQWAGYP